MSRLPIQFITIFIIVLTLFFLWDFSQRVVTSVRLAQLEKTYEQLVAQEEERNRILRELKTYIQSDEYVIDYARRKLRWALPNDTVVIPQITPVPTPTPGAPTPTPIPTKTFQQELFDFLLGH
jgi:cell division protein FtsB